MRACYFFFFLVAAFPSSPLCATSGLEWKSAVLYQPDDMMRARVASIEGFVAYCKRLQKVAADFFVSNTTPERLDIVVGLKPGKKVRVWFVSSKRAAKDSLLLALKKRLEAVPPYAVHNGPIAFALRCTIAGGGAAPKGQGAYQVPTPQEWQDGVGNGTLLVPDGIFERIWRD